VVLLHKTWGGQFCPQPPSGGFFGLKEIPRTAPAESRRQPGLAAPQSGIAATKMGVSPFRTMVVEETTSPGKENTHERFYR
jgi:hypothetical protein